jgi:pimeloyl-ACP methyl ester carboxylesterase
MRGQMSENNIPIILLPGMGADGRLFRLQLAALPDLATPAWIEPYGQEPLTAYAERLARKVDPGEPCIVGGASFGGIVALEMATHLRTEACFLIASVRSPTEFPWRYRALRPLARLGPHYIGRVAAWAARWFAASLPRGTKGRLMRLSDPRSAFLKWASWAALDWRPTPGARKVRVYQNHGAADRTLPIRYTRPDEVVKGAGHLLPLTHTTDVNNFIRSRVERHRRPDDSGRGQPGEGRCRKVERVS